MSKVVSHMTMSLDGFIADLQDGVEELFGWNPLLREPHHAAVSV
jgi:hypothetical protein